MVDLNTVFRSLGDATRRDILERVSRKDLSVGEIAEPYTMSLAGVAKHIEVLEDAGLVKKRREGKQQIISLEPKAFRATSLELEKYEQLWNRRFSVLDRLLKRN